MVRLSNIRPCMAWLAWDPRYQFWVSSVKTTLTVFQISHFRFLANPRGSLTFLEVYTKSHNRAAAYLIGFLCGFYLSSSESKQGKQNWVNNQIIIVLSIVFLSRVFYFAWIGEYLCVPQNIPLSKLLQLERSRGSLKYNEVFINFYYYFIHLKKELLQLELLAHSLFWMATNMWKVVSNVTGAARASLFKRGGDMEIEAPL